MWVLLKLEVCLEPVQPLLVELKSSLVVACIVLLHRLLHQLCSEPNHTSQVKEAHRLRAGTLQIPKLQAQHPERQVVLTYSLSLEICRAQKIKGEHWLARKAVQRSAQATAPAYMPNFVKFL